uniref:Ssl1-like domain-containing protein n=1 Tax=Cryptomonas curvata TaxID=233186 RepID=A0A7S0MKT2_9CRYP|nr:hypothetical protein Cry52Nrm2_p026 [Cryptomonas curvata]|mmetsp:Transcript_46323/g.96911  ORF Transcript_46323/g.96911 Transcript_46323/m.96911 type:complete len:287 (+) Transcript_46323:33-893(+)
MKINLVIIIDFSSQNIPNLHYNNSEQKILSFCSMIIQLFLKKNFNQRVAIIVNRGGIAEQICHLSNNILHHIQGFRRILKDGIYGKNNIKSSILLAIRLLNFTNQKNDSEILLISSEYALNFSLHFLAANLIKNKIKFSAIEFDKKTFIYETICKLTGGLYINCNLQERKQLFFWIRNKLLNKLSKSNTKYLTLGIKQGKFIGLQKSLKKFPILFKILNYCPVCKLQISNLQDKYCFNCGVLFLKAYTDRKDKFQDFRIIIFDSFSIFNFEYNFNLLSFIYNSHIL